MNYKAELINTVLYGMMEELNKEQICELKNQLQLVLYDYDVSKINNTEISNGNYETTQSLLEYFTVCKLSSGRSRNTIKQYILVANQLCRFVNREINMITTENVVYFLAKYPMIKGVSACTMDSKRRYLSSIFGLLKKHKKISENPMDMVEQIKFCSKVKRSLSDKEIENINIAISQTKSKVGKVRNAAIMQFCLDTGVRVSELTNIDISDINFDKREVKILGKGNKERVVYFSDKTENKIKDYLSLRKDINNNSPLFLDIQNKHRLKSSGVQSMMKKLREPSGVCRLHPHLIRAQCSCNLAKAGIQIDLIAKYLGHSNLDVIQRYVVNSNERLLGELQKVGLG